MIILPYLTAFQRGTLHGVSLTILALTVAWFAVFAIPSMIHKIKRERH